MSGRRDQRASLGRGADPPLSIRALRQGMTEIALSDGRIIRASLHVKSISADADDSNNIDVSYYVVSEIVDKSEWIADTHRDGSMNSVGDIHTPPEYRETAAKSIDQMEVAFRLFF